MRATMCLNVKPASCADSKPSGQLFSAYCAKPPWSRMSATGVCVLRHARWTRHTLKCSEASISSNTVVRWGRNKHRNAWVQATVYCAHESLHTQILWPHNCASWQFRRKQPTMFSRKLSAVERCSYLPPDVRCRCACVRRQVWCSDALSPSQPYTVQER